MRGIVFSAVVACFLAGCGGGGSSSAAVTGVEAPAAVQAVSAN
jgi:hypothetical protein